MHTVGTVIGFEEDCILLDREKTQKTGNQHDINKDKVEERR